MLTIFLTGPNLGDLGKFRINDRQGIKRTIVEHIFSPASLDIALSGERRYICSIFYSLSILVSWHHIFLVLTSISLSRTSLVVSGDILGLS